MRILVEAVNTDSYDTSKLNGLKIKLTLMVTSKISGSTLSVDGIFKVTDGAKLYSWLDKNSPHFAINPKNPRMSLVNAFKDVFGSSIPNNAKVSAKSIGLQFVNTK